MQITGQNRAFELKTSLVRAISERDAKDITIRTSDKIGHLGVKHAPRCFALLISAGRKFSVRKWNC